VRSLSVIEGVALLALGATLLAATLPVFLREVQASRLVEATEGLERIGARVLTLSEGLPPATALPEAAPLTPAEVPRGHRVTDPPGTWDHPTWRRLGFALERPHAYSFELSTVPGPERATFTVRALGDLDGDGVLSTFELPGELTAGGTPRLLPMQIRREVE
jgi:hypothetical protein